MKRPGPRSVGVGIVANPPAGPLFGLDRGAGCV